MLLAPIIREDIYESFLSVLFGVDARLLLIKYWRELCDGPVCDGFEYGLCS